MPEHTPGPIHVEHEFNLIASDGFSLTSATGTDAVKFHNRSVANALHAVKCWNSHDALVAACKADAALLASILDAITEGVLTKGSQQIGTWTTYRKLILDRRKARVAALALAGAK